MDQDLKIQIGNVSTAVKATHRELEKKYLKGATLEELHELSRQLHAHADAISEIGEDLLSRS